MGNFDPCLPYIGQEVKLVYRILNEHGQVGISCQYIEVQAVAAGDNNFTLPSQEFTVGWLDKHARTYNDIAYLLVNHFVAGQVRAIWEENGLTYFTVQWRANDQCLHL